LTSGKQTCAVLYMYLCVQVHRPVHFPEIPHQQLPQTLHPLQLYQDPWNQQSENKIMQWYIVYYINSAIPSTTLFLWKKNPKNCKYYKHWQYINNSRTSKIKLNVFKVTLIFFPNKSLFSWHENQMGHCQTQNLTPRKLMFFLLVEAQCS